MRGHAMKTVSSISLTLTTEMGRCIPEGNLLLLVCHFTIRKRINEPYGGETSFVSIFSAGFQSVFTFPPLFGKYYGQVISEIREMTVMNE